jgi:NAD(P)-dependent dehydrogenase (short-subunit alcohol dehydrogenase family)
VSSALVTGGGRGVGRAVAEGLLADGWRVGITGRDPQRLAQVTGAHALAGDVTVRADVEAAVAAFGVPDLVLLNAGAFATGGPLWQGDPDAWWRDVEVNLRGPLLFLHALLPGMVARGSGRVVLVGSGFGQEPVAGASAYSVSKTAAERLVEGLALELEGSGVVALTASPGLVRTDMTDAFPEGFLAAHPEYRDRPRRDVALFVALVRRIAAGELDGLHGRFVHVTTTVDRGAGDEGTLRLVPYSR